MGNVSGGYGLAGQRPAPVWHPQRSEDGQAGVSGGGWSGCGYRWQLPEQRKNGRVDKKIPSPIFSTGFFCGLASAADWYNLTSHHSGDGMVAHCGTGGLPVTNGRMPVNQNSVAVTGFIVHFTTIPVKALRDVGIGA
jgi:hypothetical protein